MNPETYKINLTLNDVLTDTQLDAAYKAGTADLSLRPGVTRIGSRKLTKAQIEEIAVLDKVFADMGITFIVTDELNNSNGAQLSRLYGKTDGKTITAALYLHNGGRAGNVLSIAAFHELYHWIKYQGEYSKEWQRELTDTLIKILKSSDKFDYDAIYEQYEQRKNAYPDDTQEHIEEEIAAQYFGAIMADKYMSRQLIKQDTTFWGKAIEHIKSFVKKIRARIEAYYKKTGDNTVKAAMETDFETAEQLITGIEAVLQTAIEDRDNKKTAESGNVNNSVLLDKNGEPYVEIENDIISANPGKKHAQIIAEILHSKFENRIDVNGQVVQVNQKTNNEWRLSNEARSLLKKDMKLYEDKIRTIDNVDEILKTAKKWAIEASKHKKFNKYARGKIRYSLKETIMSQMYL